MMLTDQEAFEQTSDGIAVARGGVTHREEEYDSGGFELMRRMQRDHFWYRGRHRFLLEATRRQLRQQPDPHARLSAIDLGGGCGGWIAYVQAHAPKMFGELAVADSSRQALLFAQNVVSPPAGRYQIDLLNLPWESRWDVAYLLDVLEHIPEHQQALEQVCRVLKPGGLAIVTTPALEFFRTYNDELVHHVRRYSKRDYAQVGAAAGLEMVSAHYFMFFLSPLLLLSRLRSPNIAAMTPEEIQEHLLHTHRIPAWPVNETLAALFHLETPLGHWLPFPWGTSILGVFRKPL